MNPDDFKGDPYGAVTNQTGHFAIGLGVSIYLGLVGWWTVPLAALVYFVVVEIGTQALKLWRDSIMDTAHVMAGAAFGSAVMRYVLAGDYTPHILFTIWAALLLFEACDKSEMTFGELKDACRSLLTRSKR